MDIGIINQLSQEALYVLLSISMPLLMIALTVGLFVSFFQALTQIQETSLTFVPKIVAIVIGMLVFTPFMVSKLQIFMDHIIQNII
jgi:flagellar biosynthesis protein FliQ